MIICLKMWPVERRFFSHMTKWPSFWPDMTHFQTCLRFHRDKHSDHFMIIGLKIRPLECTQGFSTIWPSDPVFDPTQPIFKLVKNFIKTNILIKFHNNPTENVASRAYKNFFQDLTYWPSFWPDLTHFQTRLRFQQDKYSDQVSW